MSGGFLNHTDPGLKGWHVGGAVHGSGQDNADGQIQVFDFVSFLEEIEGYSAI